MATYNSTESSWSKNPESITIGDHETLTFSFKYYSPGKNISISLNTGNVVGHGTRWKLETIENENWVSVTVVGGQKGKGTAQLNVTTYPKEGDSVLTTTTIKVVEAIIAKQIKFFDTDNKPLADNKLIAPKHIYQIKQSDNEASKGTQCSTSNKCLKTTDSSAYVEFTYLVSTGSSMQEKSDYSWVTLSDNFVLPQTGSMQTIKTGSICLKGIINDQSRNISKNMLQKNGLPKQGGITYWYIVGSLIPMA